MSIVHISNLQNENEKKYQSVLFAIKTEMVRESIDIMRLGFFRMKRESRISDDFLSRLKKEYEATGEWIVEYRPFTERTKNYGEIYFRIVNHNKNDLFGSPESSTVHI